MSKSEGMRKRVSVRELIVAIRKLPSDKPVVSDAWYRTQKEHWLGRLGEYNTPGAYGRIAGRNRDAAYAYNHIVEPKMLLWLISGARVAGKLLAAAKKSAGRKTSMQRKSGAIRRSVSWEVVSRALFATKKPAASRDEVTTTLKREWFAEIVDGKKRVEYREIKPYWTKRLRAVKTPFRLVLRNGMIPPIPVLTVRIDRVVPNPHRVHHSRRGDYALHIGRILKVEHWDRNKRRPK